MVKIKKRTLKKIFEEEENLDVTYNKDLREYLKKYDGKKGFKNCGVIMRNEVKKLKIHDKMFVIVNYDSTDQSGSHWIVLIKNENKVYHFGSFGIPTLHEIKGHFSQFPIYYNDRAVQLTGTSICGHLCLAFIEHMLLTNKTFYQFLSEELLYSNRYKNESETGS